MCTGYALICIMITVLTFLLIIFYTNRYLERRYPTVSSFMKNERLLKEGAYDKIKTDPEHRTMFAVFRSPDVPEYYSDPEEIARLTPENLWAVPAYGSAYTYSAARTWNYSTNQMEIHISRMHAGDPAYSDDGITILNDDYQVIYGDFFQDRTELSRDEVKFLTGRYDDSHSIIRYGYRNEEGEMYYVALIFRDYTEAEHLSFKRKLSSLMYLILPISAALLFVFWFAVRRRIRNSIRPVTELLGTEKLDEIDRGIQKTPEELIPLLIRHREMVLQLKDAAEEKERQEKEQRRMIAGMAHDIKTPVTAVNGMLYAVRDGLVPGEQQEEYIDTMLKRLELIGTQADNLQQYVFMDHPEYRAEPELLDLSELCLQFLFERKEEAEAAGIRICPEIEPDLQILAGRNDILRLLGNLFYNSLRYAGSGTEIVTVLRSDDDLVRLLFGDTGPGIPKEIIDSAFLPFVTGDEIRGAKSGSGLGLAVCKRIAELYGGEIRVVSEPGYGMRTAVEVVFPKN